MPNFAGTDCTSYSGYGHAASDRAGGGAGGGADSEAVF